MFDVKRIFSCMPFLVGMLFTQCPAIAQDDLTTAVHTGSIVETVHPATMLYRSDTSRIEISDSKTCLIDGELLVSARENVNINAANCEIAIPKGAVVLIRKQQGVVCVENLLEDQSSSILVRISQKSIPLMCGQEILVAQDLPALQKVVVDDHVLRRNIKIFQLSCGGNLMHAEVSYPTLVHNSSLLNTINKSMEKSDRALSARLLRMAACLSIVTGPHGRYARITN